MRKSLTITGFERPELFRQVIVDLCACGPEGWHLHVGIEPGPKASQFGQICAALLPEGSYTFNVNAARLGVTRNPLAVLQRAFAGDSDLNLHLEEDLRLAPDALAMASWYGANRKPHWAALGLLAGPCGTAGYLSRPDHPGILTETRMFNSLGFALDRTMWDKLVQPVWASQCGRSWTRPRYLGQIGWDWALSGAIYADPALRVVQPLAARATHAGEIGEYCTPDFQKRAFSGLGLAASFDGDYHLMPLDALPRDIRSHLNSLQETTSLREEIQELDPAKWQRAAKHWLAKRLGLARQPT